jgi:hypothetical protein
MAALKFAKIERTSVASQVYDDIRESVLNGSLLPGTHLAEPQVASQMGVGFPPKVVPLEAVFLVILWKCSKNLRDQAAVVVGLWIAWASRSLRRVVHAIHSRSSHSLLLLTSYSLNNGGT